MAKLMGMTDTQAQKTVSGYSYSNVSLDQLQDYEYTIVRIMVDESSSVAGYKKELEAALENCVETCKKSPKEENILVSVGAFSSGLREIHGFIPLSQINPADYRGKIRPRGMTALYDATQSSLEATNQFGESLVKMDYLCNAIIFVITDGGENDSRVATDAAMIKRAIADIKKGERLESVLVVLIGIGDQGDDMIKQDLDEFQKEVGIDQFVWVGEATPKNLLKLGNFVSSSVSSQSQALGSNKPSQLLNISF